MAKRLKQQKTAAQPVRPEAAAPWLGSDRFLGLLLVLAIIATYSPVWRAGFIWDDSAHVTRTDLRSWAGLARIWFDPGITQQYYPLIHGLFWVEHRMWGDWPLPYHLVNVALFAASALLLVKILRQLEIPGAWLAAGIFALHPVQVESVAWVTELKNMLSGLLYFSAALAYLEFDRTRKRGPYAAALLFFLLGLISKSVIATLPAALPVIFWWKRGTLSWKRDALPLVPFFGVGLFGGLFTAWMETHIVGAHGAIYNVSFIERCLIAGRNVWFYVGKLFWPEQLIFIYPRWDIDAAAWWQYLFPAAVLGVAGVLLWLSRRWRGPLAGFLFFVGTLFPALGFFDVYPFRYSFVADHFQYLACLGIIVPCAAGLTLLCRSQFPRFPGWGTGFAVGWLLVLGIASWQRAWAYRSDEILWRDTLAKNPNCWMADNNLGLLLMDRGQLAEAKSCFLTALNLDPNNPAALLNLGLYYFRSGQIDEAMDVYRKVQAVDPENAEVYNDLGLALTQKGRFNEALPQLEQACRLKPSSADYLNNLGFVLFQVGRVDDAIACYKAALGINPHLVRANGNLGVALQQQGQLADAIACYEAALQIDPGVLGIRSGYGVALAQQGRLDEAIVQLQQAVQTEPGNAQAHSDFGNALLQKGRLDDAIAQYKSALAINPNYAHARSNLGVALLQKGDATGALAQFEQVARQNPNDPAAQKNLAQAQAKAKTLPPPAQK